MLKIVFIVGATFCLAIGQLTDAETPLNVSSNNDTKKDMYVVHAMVYQLGIISNATDENASEKNGSQAGATEALTFYHSNGSSIDLNKIPQQLLPNLTGRSFVAPASESGDNASPGSMASQKTTVFADKLLGSAGTL